MVFDKIALLGWKFMLLVKLQAISMAHVVIQAHEAWVQFKILIDLRDSLPCTFCHDKEYYLSVFRKDVASGSRSAFLGGNEADTLMCRQTVL